MKNTIICSILTFGCLSIAAQARELRDSALIYFHQGKADLDTAYNTNGDNLNRLINHINADIRQDSALRIAAVRVTGAASPEGSVEINRKLSKKRADRIFGFFSSRSYLPDSLTSFTFIGRDWIGLKELVRNDSNVPYRNEVISLIEEINSSIIADGGDNENNLQKLKNFRNGIPYTYMERELFPQLRASRLSVTYTEVRNRLGLIKPDNDGIAITADVPGIIDLGLPFPVASKCHHPFYMDLRTNMLSDILALPNIGVEFYIGKKWSVIADWTYGWWDVDRKHRYWRAYGGNVGVRRWFGKKAEEKPLTGHHLGLYAGVVTYDFEFGGKGYMGGLPGRTLWDRCNYMAGVEYGYSLPVAKRINIDFTIGLGYLGGKFIEYVPRGDEYLYQKTRILTWFGPTKAEISLVWLIGCDNYNRKKGADR